jgi:hypothetical protein
MCIEFFFIENLGQLFSQEIDAGNKEGTILLSNL